MPLKLVKQTGMYSSSLLYPLRGLIHPADCGKATAVTVSMLQCSNDSRFPTSVGENHVGEGISLHDWETEIEAMPFLRYSLHTYIRRESHNDGRVVEVKCNATMENSFALPKQTLWKQQWCTFRLWRWGVKSAKLLLLSLWKIGCHISTNHQECNLLCCGEWSAVFAKDQSSCVNLGRMIAYRGVCCALVVQ